MKPAKPRQYDVTILVDSKSTAYENVPNLVLGPLGKSVTFQMWAYDINDLLKQIEIRPPSDFIKVVDIIPSGTAGRFIPIVTFQPRTVRLIKKAGEE